MGESFMRRFWEDLFRKDLFILKMFLFTVSAANSSFTPFMTLYLQSMGLTVTEIAMVVSLQPCLVFLGPTVVGIIADRVGHIKGMMAALSFGGVLISLCFPYAPAARSLAPYSADLQWESASNGSSLIHVSGFLDSCHLRNFTDYWTIVQGELYECSTLSSGSSSAVLPISTGSDVYSPQPHNGSMVQRSLLRGASPAVLPPGNALIVDVSANAIVAHIPQHSSNGTTDTLWCSGLISGSHVCADVERYDVMAVAAVVVLCLVYTTLSHIVLNFQNVIALIMVRIKKTDIGFQVVWGLLGSCLAPPLTGLLADMYQLPGRNHANYNVGFYVAAVTGLASAISIIFLPIDDETYKEVTREGLSHSADNNPSDDPPVDNGYGSTQQEPLQKPKSSMWQIMKDPVFHGILLIQLASGAFAGFILSYLFLFLAEINASASLMGLTSIVGGAAAAIFILLSGVIFDHFPHEITITLTLFLYGARFIGYSLIYDPSLALVLHAADGINNNLLEICVITFVSEISPYDIFMSAEGVAQGMQDGVGKGVGSLIGGLLISWFGSRFTFQVMSIAATAVASIYYIFYMMCPGKRQMKCSKDENQPLLEEESVDKPQLVVGKISLNAPIAFYQSPVKSYHEVAHKYRPPLFRQTSFPGAYGV